MRKSNTITFLFFVTLIGATMGLMYVRELPQGGFCANILEGFGATAAGVELPDFQQGERKEMPIASTVLDEVKLAGKPPVAEAQVSDPLLEEAELSREESREPARNALFIGDSRTVGIWEYAGLTEADFFANVGMSVFNVWDKPLSVSSVGEVTLEELLDRERYAKIYLMLGINELGYGFDEILPQYEKLVTWVREKQPEAVIFVQANLHVTASRSQSDAVINNDAINRLNGALAELAAAKGAFYLDANPIFDDGAGALSSEKSEDNVHLYAKYYVEWGQWILQQTDFYCNSREKEVY